MKKISITHGQDRVIVNGAMTSSHNMRDEAIQQATNALLLDPTAGVVVTCADIRFAIEEIPDEVPVPAPPVPSPEYLVSQSFDNFADYSGALVRQSGNIADYSSIPGYSGNALRILPPNDYSEGYGGIDITIPIPRDTVYVRWLVRIGPTLSAAMRGNNKHLILNRTDNSDGGARVIATLHPYGSDGNLDLPLTNNINDPTGTPFRFDNYENQWVCVEVGVSVSGNFRRMWVTTRDGEYQDRLVQDGPLSGHNALFSGINLGYYWQQASQIPRNGTNYLDLDYLAVSVTKIGPPVGFV